MRRHLGDTCLAHATTGVLITAYDLEAGQALALGTGADMSMVDAAHASSAAPTYFEPVRAGARTLIDGGVFAVNPAALAYAGPRECVTGGSRSGLAERGLLVHDRCLRTGRESVQLIGRRSHPGTRAWGVPRASSA